MEFSEYQEQAIQTFGAADDKQRGTLIALLGLAGEAGTLAAEYKKLLRDGKGHLRYEARILEDLGDILWYTAALAHCFDADLGEIAQMNLAKTQDRYDGSEAVFRYQLYDDAFPDTQQFPRTLTLLISEDNTARPPRIVLTRDGKKVGATLDDNAYDDDGYRFHDVLHLAHAAVLGWSPVARALLDCKRRADPQTDRVQDGGRAIVIEEGITALVYEHAQDHAFYASVKTVDTELLDTVRRITSRLEVSSRTAKDWERAILAGYEVWRAVRANRGGWVDLDLTARTIRYRPVVK